MAVAKALPDHECVTLPEHAKIQQVIVTMACCVRAKHTEEHKHTNAAQMMQIHEHMQGNNTHMMPSPTMDRTVMR